MKRNGPIDTILHANTEKTLIEGIAPQGSELTCSESSTAPQTPTEASPKPNPGKTAVLYPVTEEGNLIEMEMKTYNELKRRQSMAAALENLIEAKRVFIRKISHEIRSPLDSISCGLDLLVDASSGNTEALDVIEDLRYSCSHAVRVLDDLLTYDKLEGNSLILSRTSEDLQDLVIEAMASFTSLAKNSRVNLSFVHHDSAKVVVCLDKEKMLRVIGTLLTNALKFTPSGGDVTLSISVDPSQSRTKLEVRDTGPGLDQQRQDAMFKDLTFSMAELQSEQGYEPALYIAYRITQLHGGRMGVYSEGIGKGSSFYVELPLTKLIRPHSPSSERHRNNGRPSLRRLLVVDDVVMCRKLHSKTMARYCDEVEEASNGVEAVSAVHHSISSGRPYDCILMDSSMPFMDGLEATKRIRSLGYTGKLFGVTGNALPSDIDNFRCAGADSIFIKPLTKENIVDILHAVSGGV